MRQRYAVPMMASPIHVRVTSEQKLALEEVARAKGLDQSTLIRQALDAYLGHRPMFGTEGVDG